MITKEEILEAAKHCVETGGICENCPFRINKTNCELSFANYIKENESKPVIKNISKADEKLQEFKKAFESYWKENSKCQYILTQKN